MDKVGGDCVRSRVSDHQLWRHPTGCCPNETSPRQPQFREHQEPGASTAVAMPLALRALQPFEPPRRTSLSSGSPGGGPAVDIVPYSRALAGGGPRGPKVFNRSGSQPVLHVVRPGDLIPDNRLLPREPDLLEHEAIAKGLAEIALTATTPVNIALFGAWGSGKSSIYTMVGDHLADITGSKVKVARYDAWKYGGKELKRNFVESLAADLQLGNDPELSAGLESSVSDTRINLGSWFWKNRNSLLFGLLLAVGLTVLWVLTIAIAASSPKPPSRRRLAGSSPRPVRSSASRFLLLCLVPKSSRVRPSPRLRRHRREQISSQGDSRS